MRTLPHGLSQLTHFFGQPRDGRRNSASSISFTESPIDDPLKFGEIHEATVGDAQPSVDETQPSRDSSPFSPEVRPFTVPSAPTNTMNGYPLTP